MKYFFILGRNPELSRAELFVYLHSRNVEFQEVVFEENLLILDLVKFDFNVQLFGGILSIGKLIELREENELKDYLDKNEFIPLDKFTYSVSGNMDSFIFSEKFKKDKKKAQIRTAGKKLKFQSGEKIFLPNVDVEIVAHVKNNDFMIGTVEQKFDSKNVEKRDMQKPFRRESLAISPRLAKILINLSGAKEGNLILDPFCGVGGIMQEALLKEINCVGIDVDRDAISGARENLSWLKEVFNFNATYKLTNQNSLNAEDKKYDAIVAESSLGDVLRRKLSGKAANNYLDSFQEKIVPLLRKFKNIKKPSAKIAITFPCFESSKIDSEEILNLTGLRLYAVKDVEFPIEEKRKDQFVNRQIWVFY